MADTILVIDDSASIRQLMSIILKGAGYDVVTAENGPQGLELLREDTVAVISDFNMPEMNGVEVVRTIRNGTVNRSVPVLIVTTESEQEKKTLAKEAGATGWITKPFDKDTLLKSVAKVTTTVSF